MNQLRSILLMKRREGGFSLIELMIAIALGLLIMAAVIQLFIGSRQTYSTNEALARVQENGRFAMELIKPEIRGLASGQGFCAGQIIPRNHLNLACNADMANLFDQRGAIQGWEYTGTGIQGEFPIPADLSPSGINRNNWRGRNQDQILDLPAVLENRVVPGSDVLVLQQMETLAVEIDGVQSDNRIRVVSGGDQIPPRGIMMVVNCALGGDIFQGSPSQGGEDIFKPNQDCDADGEPGNRPPGQSPWAHDHDGASSLVFQRTYAYYVGFNANRNEPGLYRMDMSAGLRAGDLVEEELVEGIENMQVLFGFSNPANQGGDGQSVDFWLTSDQVTDWGLVIAVRISMLARSQSNAESRAQSFVFDLAGTELTTPTDRRLRQPFNTTLALRNRVVVQ